MVAFPPEFPFVKRKPAEPQTEPPRQAAPAEPVKVPSHSAPPVEKPARVDPPAPVARAEPPPTRPESTPAATAASAPAPAAPRLVERRKFRRDPMAAQALVRVDSFPGPPIKVGLLDISVAGVRFRADRPMEVGEKAQVRLEVGPFRWTTRLRVIYCNRDGERVHSIGCAFLRTELLRPWPTTAS